MHEITRGPKWSNTIFLTLKRGARGPGSLYW